MKKIINGLSIISLLIILCITAFAFSASAANAVAVSSTGFQTHQGESFTTTICIPDGANIVDFDITLKYDTELLTLVSATENEDMKGTVVFNTDTAGLININYTRTSQNVTTELPLVDLVFEVDENAGVGAYDCLSVDKTATYIAHRLTDSSTLVTVNFDCDFAELVIYETGDVDLSKSVDIGDATYIRRHLAQFEGAALSEFKLSLADTYCDDNVDIADAVCLQRHLAKLDVTYGNRVNVTFNTFDGSKYATKSVIFNGTLNTIPAVPQRTGYSGGVWSQSATEYIAPVYSELQNDTVLYAYYEPGSVVSEAMEYYKGLLTDMYYSGDIRTNLSSDLNLNSSLYYQSGWHASVVWNSDCNYVLNSTTGAFTKPTYPQDLTLGIKIISYDAENKIDSQDIISFTYNVPGLFITPSKSEIADWVYGYFTDDKDEKYRVNYDVKLISSINNEIIPVNGSRYDNYEVRLDWYQKIDGTEVPISQIERKTSSQVNDYVAVATFNGKPLEDDGKIYIDNVEVTAIEQIEIKNHIIQKIAASMGTLATDATELWNDDAVYGTTVTWETGAPEIAYVSNNTIELKPDAVSGSTLPLNARVSYAVDGGTDEFVLSYNLTVSSNNTIIKAPENMDQELYSAIKAELEDKLGYRGDLTSAALGDVRFVNLDLSGYPDITSLRGLSYCTNLRTLNISGLHITDGTMNQIATLSYLEAFIARGCGLDNLTDGGTATLRNAVNLRLIDLTNNNFTSLDSVFAEGKKYGKLREVYLSSNRLTDINALSRAPIMAYLSLSDNGLTTEGTASIANYPFLLYLSLADNEIDSVTHLEGLRYLKELRLQNNNLTNVNGLRKLINLEILYLGHNDILDVGFLNTLTALNVLYVNDNRISDISSLTALSELKAINVSNNNISSLSVLANYKDTLTEIYAENNNITDFSFINGAANLHILMLGGNDTVLAQDNMVTWLTGLENMEVLTLSGVRLNNLSFLSSMAELVRLDVANCGLTAFNGDDSNIAKIAERYATLKVLNISNNDFSGYEDEILSLRNATLLTVLYADNICDALDAYTLTYSMNELKYISLENCGITSMGWIAKYYNLAYVDLAGNNISEVNLGSFISNASHKTIEELYLDTNVNCSFADAYRVTDFNVKKLSLEGVSVGKVEKLPYLDCIDYLNLGNTGITNFTGDDPELVDMYSVERYTTLKTLDVSHLYADLTMLESLTNLETLYAVGTADTNPNNVFCKTNLTALYNLYNAGKTVYLYDKDEQYTPVSTVEGKEVLDLMDDISCDVTVAANNMLSDNNPYLIDSINGFDVTWTVSNSTNYEIVNNHLSVKDYTYIDDESLTLTASIDVYPSQAPATRSFTINTDILRAASTDYFDIDATGISDYLVRESSFSYDVDVKAFETEGFAATPTPVYNDVKYTYSAVTSGGTTINHLSVLTLGADHAYAVSADAPLNSKVTINVAVGHYTSAENFVVDRTVSRTITISSRTFTVTYVPNGGTVKTADNVPITSEQYPEGSTLFENVTVARTGYLFDGWFTDEACTTAFTATVMPSEDITLYAKWTAHSFNVNFNANGGTVSPASKLALCNQPFGELPEPVRTGFEFAGWYTDATAGTAVTPSTVQTAANDLTVYAHWTALSYTVSWTTGTGYSITVNRTASPYYNAATGELNSGATVYYGDELSITYEAATGYSLATNGSSSVTVTDNVTASTIYATANPNSYTYNIVYKSSHGTALGSSTATYAFGTTNTITPPAKSGYNTPAAQSVVWDSTSEKTIIFSYSATQPSKTTFTKTAFSSSMTLNATVEYQNRTATTVQVRLKCTMKLNSGKYNGYKHSIIMTAGGKTTSEKTIVAFGQASTSGTTGYTEWLTVPVTSSKSTVSISYEWIERNVNNDVFSSVSGSVEANIPKG